MSDSIRFTGNIVSEESLEPLIRFSNVCLFVCLIVKQTWKLQKKLGSERLVTCWERKKELNRRLGSQNTASEEVTAGDVTHTNNCMHENQPELSDSWLWVELVYEDAIHHERSHTATVVHTGTNTSSTHSDVRTHIPLVGSWSKVRKCEICQPIGDWVIEEFDSERNILLPWWWTRRSDIVFSRRKV